MIHLFNASQLRDELYAKTTAWFPRLVRRSPLKGLFSYPTIMIQESWMYQALPQQWVEDTVDQMIDPMAHIIGKHKRLDCSAMWKVFADSVVDMLLKQPELDEHPALFLLSYRVGGKLRKEHLAFIVRTVEFGWMGFEPQNLLLQYPRTPWFKLTDAEWRSVIDIRG